MHRLGRLLRYRVLLAVAALGVLAAASGQLLGQEAPEPPEAKIERLIEQLGDDKYSVRSRAEEELAELGFEAFDALSDAATHEDPEIAARAKYLLVLIQARWSAANEPAEVRRYLAYYQSHSRDTRTAVLKGLAQMSGWIGVPTLCRLVRFEKSPRWSKEAAVAILDWEPTDEAGRAGWGRVLRGHLGRNGPPAAGWLRTYLWTGDNPKAPPTKWASVVEEERALFERAPSESSAEIVRSLLYHLAMIQADRGEPKAAQATATEASELRPSEPDAAAASRYDTALMLQRRGRFRWADLEYRRAIKVGTTKQKVSAQIVLSEMWHDQRDHLAAAKVLEETLRIDEEELEQILGADGRSVGAVRARMGYFYACHWLEKGDRARQRKHLDEAVTHDPTELDVLIARHQLPDASAEYRRETIQWIEMAVAGLRKEIGESPRTASGYNQLAWLVGNTEGDQDEALRCAEKALQLRPGAGAYLDTLAHVYFGRGDLENAVKHQTEAARAEPYSGLIAQKLDLFRKALDESRKKEQ